MEFMVIMIPAVYRGKVDPDFEPPADKVKKMMEFNEELTQAGVLVSLNGLKPLASGARVAFAGGKPTVTDGPFIESKEVIGGYWMLNCTSKQDVINWMRRCPADDGDVIEIRPLFGL